MKNPKSILGVKIDEMKEGETLKARDFCQSIWLGIEDVCNGSSGLPLSDKKIYTNFFIEIMEIYMGNLNYVFFWYIL